MARTRLSKLEKNWILYDVGNSAFIMMVSTIIPIYFKNIAQDSGVSAANSTAYWGYASSLATVIIALVGPIMGTIADTKGFKKPMFLSFLFLGAAACAFLAVPLAWLAFLVVFVIAKVGYSGSIIFYDSMLTDITTDDRMDVVSSQGYAWGYIGSCIPFVAGLGLVLTADQTGLGSSLAMSLAFLITAGWWLLTTIPLMKNYNQLYYVERRRHPVRDSFSRLWNTLRDIRGNKKIFTFLIAFFLYIDGVYTIIEMATSYGKDVGISDNDLLLALLLTQVVAFPFAILFGRLSKRFETHKLIIITIVGYLAISLFAIQLDKTWEFWFLAVCVAVFQGGIQALSRSYFAKIIPKEKSNEYFGLFDIFGKGAAFAGILIMSLATQITGSSRYGVIAIAVLFVIGFLAFRAHRKVSSGE